jgi:hypothetical protein
VVLQRTLDEVADSALMVAQTGVGIWKGGLQKADDQVGIGDFHAIDRDERHLSTRRIANALLGEVRRGFLGNEDELSASQKKATASGPCARRGDRKCRSGAES